MSDAVLGAVLVGGASRRMGRDKASLPLAGTPMAHRVQRALFDGGVGAVVHVGGQGEEGSVEDRWPGEGPLAALATAVAHGASVDGVEVVVVVACDQPGVPPALVGELAHALLGAPAEVVAAAVRTSDGRRQPFPSAWRTGAAPGLVALVEAGQRRADASFGVGAVVDIEAPDALVDDLDTPEDVERWLGRDHGDGGGVPGKPW